MAIAASLVFFLPAAISMNTQTPPQPMDGTAGIQDYNGSIGAMVPLPAGAQLTPKNKKGSLSLKTAAIVGSSSAAAAAFLLKSRIQSTP